MNSPRALALLLVLTACGTDPSPKSTTDSGPTGPDVSERLSDGEVRAGIVANGAALFGGTSAEGQEGDIKLYNSRVQFIIQAMREGDYYEATGGGLIDVDIVRPEGQPGRDIIDEFGVMVGFGRIVEPSAVEVINDGTDGNAAVVRVTGRGAPMTLLTGALESTSVVPSREVAVVTEYTLEPDTFLLDAKTTISWEDEDTAIQPGDIVMVGLEVAEFVFPGRGLESGDVATNGDWMAVLGQRNEVAVAVFSTDTPFAQGGFESLLSELGPVIAPLGPATTLSNGDTLVWHRQIGVAPDLATLTDAWNASQGASTQAVGGYVQADGQPVPGARVHILDGDAVETIAFTDDQGRFNANVRAASPSALATGRGPGEHVDVPEGAGWVAPYAHPEVAAAVLDSLANGALPIPFAEGYGVSEVANATADTQLSLTAPGHIRVRVADGRPASVRVDFASGDALGGSTGQVRGRPGGAMAQAYTLDGDISLPVEPGDYTVTVHRGLRFEPSVTSVTVDSGGEAEVNATLTEVVAPAGFLTLDPHSHASPSGDGGICMSHRLASMAGNGVQVHFGTDHDHVADYRPLLAPLGLDGVMTSIVANEASPVLRGHTNVYPLTQLPELPNAGAPRWWDGMVDTETWYQTLRTWAGPDAIIQVNHPAGSSGMLDAAGYNTTTGEVASPDHFSEGFDVIEVLNDGQYAEFFVLWLDLVARGYNTTPVGVSDSHGYRNGVGENLTYLPLTVSQPSDLDPSDLADALREGGTLISRGPFLDVRVGSDWAPGSTFAGSPTLTVDVQAASFVVVDTIDLLENGVVVDSRPWTGSSETFPLSPSADAFYVVQASGSTPMAPVFPSRTPWAATSAIRVDLDGDGWTPPLPPLSFGR